MMMNKKKLFIKTYGCQMNVYDSIKIEELLNPFGIEKTEEINIADIIILNTCHIREKATEKIYSELGRVKKIKDKRIKTEQKATIVIVAGCTGQAEGDEIFKREPIVDIVVGPQSYYTLPLLITKVLQGERQVINLDFIEEEKFDHLPKDDSIQKTSAFVSIQEGCNKFCTFCVVPYTRGNEFSRPVEEIYRESMFLVNNGVKEINLLGQNVNAYHGKTYNGKTSNLAALISYLSNIKGLERIRYTTSHPIDMTNELIHLHGIEKKLMPFLHLPIQSGSNKILKLMNRKHTQEEYTAIIKKLRISRPDIVLSSDFIVGFPGETDEDFSDTINLVKKIRFGQCYSFKYSARPGTPAAIKKQVPEKVKNERLQYLQKELMLQQFKFNQSCIGKIFPVLFTKEGKKPAQILGKTPYMQSTYIDNITNKKLMGKIIDIKITDAFPTSLLGKIIN